MAILKFKQVGAGRNGNAKGNVERSYTVAWIVIVNSPLDGPLTIGNDSRAPLRFSPYVGYESSDDHQAVCNDLKVEQDGEDWQKWRVTATFATQGSNPAQQPNPEDEPALFWIETDFTTRKTTKTWDGEDIKNAAGQLIDGLTKPDCQETWIWERNYNTVNRSVWNDYQNTTNSDTVGEIAPKEGLLNIVVSRPVYRNGEPFVRVQFRVRVNKDKWTVNPADRGTAVRNASGKLERPVDEMGNPMDGEVPLKEDGTQERDADAEPRYIGAKDILKPMPFSVIGLS